MTDNNNTSAEFLLAKRLAHNDLHVRNKAVKAMRKWLARRKVINDVEMMKLWRGLHYCFWMSDKVHVQQELSKSIAETMMKLPYMRAMEYFVGFLDVMIREWTGLDRLRMDKFMTFVRHMVRASLSVLKQSNWNGELIKLYVLILVECHMNNDPDVVIQENHLQQSQFGSKGGVLQLNNKATRGLALHIADVFFDELDGVNPVDIQWPQLCNLLEPFVQIVASSNDKPLIKRCRVIFKRIVNGLMDPEGRNDSSWIWRAIGGKNLNNFSMYLLAIASDENTRESLRSFWYNLRMDVLRVLSELLINNNNNNDDSEEKSNGDSHHQKKKKKKKKKKRNRSNISSSILDSLDMAPAEANDDNDIDLPKKKKKHNNNNIVMTSADVNDNIVLQLPKQHNRKKKKISDVNNDDDTTSSSPSPKKKKQEHHHHHHHRNNNNNSLQSPKSNNEDNDDDATTAIATTTSSSLPPPPPQQQQQPKHNKKKKKKSVTFAKTKRIKTFNSSKPPATKKSTQDPIEALKSTPERSILSRKTATTTPTKARKKKKHKK